jgi:hypothetical protein
VAAAAGLILLTACTPASNLQATTEAGNAMHPTETQPALEILSGLALIVGLIWLPLGQVLAWLAWPFSAYTTGLVQFFAHLQSASFALGETALAVVAMYYAALFGLTCVLAKPAADRPAWWAHGTADPLGGRAGGAAGRNDCGVDGVRQPAHAQPTARDRAGRGHAN